MSVNSSRPRAAAPPVLALLPIIAVVFIAYLVIGLALPVLPLHVHVGLGLGAFVVGLVAGSQFAAALIWLAPSSALALVGVTLTGLGYSLVHPGFGVEAVRHTPPQSRGLAMGAYTAFLDLSLGLASPALGLVASGADLGAVFLVSTLVVLCAAAIAVRLLTRICNAPVRTAHGVPTSVGVSRESIRRGKLKPGSWLSVVFTVGGPLV